MGAVRRERSTEIGVGTYTEGRDCAQIQKGSPYFLMATVTYILASGVPREVDLAAGTSVMQGALNNRIEGILGECGGNAMCATCHVYVEPPFVDRIPPAKENEKFMLSIAAEGPQPNSRLSCQIKMTDELNGLIVRIPRKQK